MSNPIDPDGYIKSWRRIMYNDFLMNDNTAYIVFTKLLHLANRRTGVFTTGRFHLAERTNINPSTLYKALKRLEDNGMVTLSSDSHKTSITICKWKQYQGVGDSKSSSQVTARRQPGNSQGTLNKKEKEKEKKGDVVVRNAKAGNERASRDTVDRIRGELAGKGVL